MPNTLTQHDRHPNDTRERLLSTLPVRERQLGLAGVRTSLIWERGDRAIRLGVAEDASARYGWPLHVIDDAGDEPKLERPDAFLDALSEVLGGRVVPGRTG